MGWNRPTHACCPSLAYMLLFSLFSFFLLSAFQEQAGHPKGSLSDWCPGVMLIDFMVAYPGRRDEVHSGGAITVAQDILHFYRPPFSPMDQSSIHPHTLQVERAKGRVVLSLNCDSCVSALVLLSRLMGNLGVSWSWSRLSLEVNAAIVFWHGRGCRLGSYLWCASVIHFVCGFKVSTYCTKTYTAPSIVIPQQPWLPCFPWFVL